MSVDQNEDKSILKWSGNFGSTNPDSKFWDDLEIFGERTLYNMKIIKIKVYTGEMHNLTIILGLSITYKNLSTGKTIEKEHKGCKNFIDLKEFVISNDEYLTEFHIRVPLEAEYITQIGYSTNKRHFLVPEIANEGEDKSIQQNGGDYRIVGTYGCFNERLNASGCYFISKKDYIKYTIFPFFALRYLSKKDAKFKENWDKKYTTLPVEYQYIWKLIALPESLFFNVIKY
jgi:hypothetical protein